METHKSKRQQDAEKKLEVAEKKLEEKKSSIEDLYRRLYGVVSALNDVGYELMGAESDFNKAEEKATKAKREADQAYTEHGNKSDEYIAAHIADEHANNKMLLEQNNIWQAQTEKNQKQEEKDKIEKLLKILEQQRYNAEQVSEKANETLKNVLIQEKETWRKANPISFEDAKKAIDDLNFDTQGQPWSYLKSLEQNDYKYQYRREALKHHPDKIIAVKSPEFIKLTEALKASEDYSAEGIKEAYEQFTDDTFSRIGSDFSDQDVARDVILNLHEEGYYLA